MPPGCSTARGRRETTLEANPDDLTEEYLAALRRAGVDRLSIGVQSFDDDCLRLMNRRHTAGQAAAAIRAAQRAGFDNIAVDLIFGVPGFGGDALRRSLDATLGSDVQHVSAYHLTVEPDTAFGRIVARGRMRPVDEETSEREFRTVHDALVQGGFEHYEVSNFARPGFRARHNASYWRGEVPRHGPAAHSFDGAARRWNIASVAAYVDGAAGGSSGSRARPVQRVPPHAAAYGRRIDLGEAEARFGAARAARILSDGEPMLRAACCAATADAFRSRGVARSPTRRSGPFSSRNRTGKKVKARNVKLFLNFFSNIRSDW